MAIASPPLQGDKPVTVDEHLTLGEGPPYYELYAGELRVTPPTTDHQDIVPARLRT